MFSRTNIYYDQIYSNKKVESETKQILKWIEKYNPQASECLDAGCGTSQQHEYLGAKLKMEGFDLDPEMVRLSKIKHPENRYFIANLADFDAGKSYDVICCLFSSIGYLKTKEELKSSFECFYRHLNEGGLLILEPWFQPKVFKTGHSHLHEYKSEELNIARMSEPHVDGDLSRFIFHYLIGKPGVPVEYFTEEHILRLTTNEEMTELLKSSGFEVKHEEEGLLGRGMFFGLRK